MQYRDEGAEREMTEIEFSCSVKNQMRREFSNKTKHFTVRSSNT